jgi:hypothetical protein
MDTAMKGVTATNAGGMITAATADGSTITAATMTIDLAVATRTMRD